MLSLRNFSCGTAALSSSYSLSLTSPPYSLFPCRLVSKRDEVPTFRCCCSLRVRELSMEEHLESRQVFRLMENVDLSDQLPSGQEKKEVEEKEEKEEEENENGISRIQVAREKYIPVSKSELLDAIVLKFFGSDQEDAANQFILLSSCLDSILHAEHKSILEEMRADYSLTHSFENQGTTGERTEGNTKVNGKNPDSVNGDINGNGSMACFGEDGRDQMPLYFDYGLDFRNFLGSTRTVDKKCSNGDSRLAVATRFQRTFMQLLNNAQFEELSARDLMLTSALNSDYLLTLPVYVDWKKASESNAIIFKRGYATERQKGLLIVEKLDYLQSRLLQKIFFLVSKPLGKVGSWIKEATRNAYQTEVQEWVKKMTWWLEQLSLFQKSYFDNEQSADNPLGIDQLSDSDLPIWLAAQRAVSRYEGFLSPVGPRGRLIRKLLTWTGLIPPVAETPYELDSYTSASVPHLRTLWMPHYRVCKEKSNALCQIRPIFLSRISLSDLWKPATRRYGRHNLWGRLKTSFSILFSRSVLQVVFPNKKLSFRIIDTVRLDIATILGLSAYFINYKFENILSSPSAIFLDVVAVTALIIYVTRVALGYKQTWDRYQLLVNKTLYEKTLASGFGSVHFLLDASEQQQYKEAILTYAILLETKNEQVTCRLSVGDECERFMYDMFKVKVQMPVDKAINTLVRLGLVLETPVDGRITLQAVPCVKAQEALKERWNSLIC